MSEKEKIMSVVSKYKNYFDGGDFDVAFTVSEKYYFHEIEIDGFVNCTRFNTAEELEKIILANIIGEIHNTNSVGAEYLNFEFNQMGELPLLNDDPDLKQSIYKIHQQLELIKEQHTFWNEQMERVSRCLEIVSK